MGKIKWGRGDQLSVPLLYALLELRNEALIVEPASAVRDLDGRDLRETTWHGWVIEPETGRMAACVRLLCDMEPAQIGRVAVREPHRGPGGLADWVANAAHERAGGAGSFLEAPRHQADWFASLGWSVIGDEFVEDGIARVPMRRARG